MEDYRTLVSYNHNNCACEHLEDTPLRDLPLTMAYVPMQTLGEVYEPEDALCAGTLYPALDKPFCGRRWDV